MTTDRPIGYMLKRYPRLSETFILNEMRALERLGTRLHIFSLLRPEETLAHPAVTEIQAPVTYLPELSLGGVAALIRGHALMARLHPLRYGHAVALAWWWALRSRHPVSVAKQFARAGYMAKACRAQGIKHLHAHFANAPATVARLVSILCAIPYSFSTHAKDLYLTPQKVMRRRIKSASFVLTCTRHNLEYMQSFIPASERAKIHLVYHGIDLSAFPNEATPKGAHGPTLPYAPVVLSAPLILAVGRLVPKKGLNDLISACALLRARGVPFRCAIVGEGPLRQALETQIREAALEGAVSLLGAMAHDRLLALYGTAQLFALSPRIMEDGDRDGIPNVLAEAMAAGLPVVSTRVSGIPELVDHGETGLLVGPTDPDALADAIEHLLSHPTEGQRLGAAARRKMEASFECWETAKAVQRLLQVGVG